MTKTFNRRAGFTLMEILIVLGILVALFALLLPTVFNQFKKWDIQKARIQVKQLDAYITQYGIENRGVPTTEQGLYALVYVPNNSGGLMLPVTPPGITPGGLTDPMSGGAVNAGPEAFGPLGMTPDGMTPMPGGDLGVLPGVSPGAAPGAAVDPITGQPMANAVGGFDPITGNPIDPAANNVMGTGGTTGMGAAWTQPFHNPQLYLNAQKRATPYVKDEQELIDPWGNPYRYENTRAFYGLNRTGTANPAIWSAGPDGLDNNDDDVRNWEPAESQRLLAEQQMRMQQGGGTNIGPIVDPNNPMIDPNNPMSMDPTQLNPGFPQPNTGFLAQPNTGFPAQPNAGFPAQTGTGAPTLPNPGFPPQPNTGVQPPPGTVAPPLPNPGVQPPPTF